MRNPAPKVREHWPFKRTDVRQCDRVLDAGVSPISFDLPHSLSVRGSEARIGQTAVDQCR